MTILAARHVVLGVAGGIASYKSCYLARRLVDAGAAVDVILTRAGSEFVRPVTFETLTGRPVLTSLWDRGRALDHIAFARNPDLIILAPATAHLLARAAQGMADDILTAVILARTGPILAAPAMNDAMYAAESTTRHIKVLSERGWRFIGPDVGPLAEGESVRPGRMSEPEIIAAEAERLMLTREPWRGRTVIVTAGPTREWIDPVRLVTNPSTGLMGFAIAEAVWRRGADVELIIGPTQLLPPHGPTSVPVTTTLDMRKAVAARLPTADALFMAAAPADYKPLETADQKRPRTSGSLALEFEPTPDILEGTASLRKNGALIVGFALETGPASDRARSKLESKGLDFIVLNDALEPGAGFESPTNRVMILGRDATEQEIPKQPKAGVADAILDAVEGAM